MLGLVVAFRPALAQWMAQHGRIARRAGVAAIAIILVLPVALIRPLRFDLEPPQPTLWQLGHQVARDVAPGDRLALVVPGDTDDSVGSMLRGVLMFTPPRRPGIDVRTETNADAATLDGLAAAGYGLALVTCTPTGLPGIPGHVAALLRHSDGEWRVLDTWPYPPHLKQQHFAALLARGPLCATNSPD